MSCSSLRYSGAVKSHDEAKRLVRSDPRPACRAKRTVFDAGIAAVLMLFLVSACVPGGIVGGEAPSAGPTVMAVDTFAVTKSTHIYAQGMAYEYWGDTSGAAIDLLLDLYIPEDAPGLRPAAIFIHGGGFVGGTREQGALPRMAETLASRGWVCISVDYRLAGDHGMVPQAWLDYGQDQPVSPKERNQGLAIYAASRDVKAALRWLTARADSYAVDVTKLTALGGSAGAVLAVMLGATEPEDFRDELTASEDPTLLTTTLDAPSDVHSIVDFWGSAVAVEILEEVYGVTRFDSGDAPLLIIHGTEDPTVPFEKALQLEEIWTDTGVPFESHALIGAGHGAWNRTIDGQPLVEIAFDFIVRQQGLVVRY